MPKKSNIPLGADFKGYRLHYAMAGIKLIWAILIGNREQAQDWWDTWTI